MPGTPGARTGLAAILGTDTGVTIYRSTVNAVISWLEGNAMLTSAGLLSARPVSTPGSPGISGRRYYATDTGVEYRDTGTSWVALGVELVTSLPASPFNGQIVDYLADATNGIVWRLRYRSASASAYKWECIGGRPLFTGTTGQFDTPSAGSWATTGTQLVLPALAGDWDVEATGEIYNNTNGGQADLGISVNASTPAAASTGTHQEPTGANSNIETITIANRITGLAASPTLSLRTFASTGIARIARRTLAVIPARVG